VIPLAAFAQEVSPPVANGGRDVAAWLGVVAVVIAIISGVAHVTQRWPWVVKPIRFLFRPWADHSGAINRKRIDEIEQLNKRQHAENTATLEDIQRQLSVLHGDHGTLRITFTEHEKREDARYEQLLAWLWTIQGLRREDVQRLRDEERRKIEGEP
jgi:hypothetical protein